VTSEKARGIVKDKDKFKSACSEEEQREEEEGWNPKEEKCSIDQNPDVANDIIRGLEAAP